MSLLSYRHHQNTLAFTIYCHCLLYSHSRVLWRLGQRSACGAAPARAAAVASRCRRAVSARRRGAALAARHSRPPGTLELLRAQLLHSEIISKRGVRVTGCNRIKQKFVLEGYGLGHGPQDGKMTNRLFQNSFLRCELLVNINRNGYIGNGSRF